MATILVVEDDRALSAALAEALENAGHEVVVSHDGEAGVILARRNPVDLVITDIYMPGKDGLEVISELKLDYPHVKIIAVSGGGRVVHQDPLRAAEVFGADRVFPKPLNLTRLLDAIEELLAPSAPPS